MTKKYYIFVYANYYSDRGFNDFLCSVENEPCLNDVINLIEDKYNSLVEHILQNNEDISGLDWFINDTEVNPANEQNCFRGHKANPADIDEIQIVDITTNRIIKVFDVENNQDFKTRMEKLYKWKNYIKSAWQNNYNKRGSN